MLNSAINKITEIIKIPLSHTRYSINIEGCSDFLDVLNFKSEEFLSQPWQYYIELTCKNANINPENILLKPATFCYRAPLFQEKLNDVLRQIYGVVKSIKYIKTSSDETHYAVTLIPRIALLHYTQRSEIYLNQSAIEVVEKVLRRHGFEGIDFEFQLSREYPVRELITQWQETDLVFIQRILAEVGVYWRTEMDIKLKLDKVIFQDSQIHYQFGTTLPYRHQSGMNDSQQESIWGLQVTHQVTSASVSTRDYNYRQAFTPQDSSARIAGFETHTTGEIYHYAPPFISIKHDPNNPNGAETGAFYANLDHERQLNSFTCVCGSTTSPNLIPGQVLDFAQNDLGIFQNGILITQINHSGARDTALNVRFIGQIYNEKICFRPTPPPRPIIAGTLPAKIESHTEKDIYAWLDKLGRYRVKLDFDREQSEAGYAYLWLRLAKPYAGNTYGWHTPLVDGTEVAIQFDGGDPDRPYIAYALHNSEHPDLVTLDNHTRNILRTPANNKLRMEDKRQQEHIKLATEYGKTQLNLGHLVNAQREQRGAGFELRTDEYGTIRAAKGLYITADEQLKAQGNVLEMTQTVKQIQQANDEMQALANTAKQANALVADIQSQITLLDNRLKSLQSAVLLASAPQGIAITSGEHLQLASKNNTFINAGKHIDIGAMHNLSIAVEKELGVFAHKEEVTIIANQGAIEISAQHNSLDVFAKQQISITSSEDEIIISTPQTLILNGGGSYLKLNEQGIEQGSAGDYIVKAANYLVSGSSADLACETKHFSMTEIDSLDQVSSKSLHD